MPLGDEWNVQLNGGGSYVPPDFDPPSDPGVGGGTGGGTWAAIDNFVGDVRLPTSQQRLEGLTTSPEPMTLSA
jgi:hypothetical protein